MELDQQNSDSSSIRNLRLGPPPNATPDPHATYKVKRSPSADTEEFLKVDISIRGGTSYLPSEARRIHTPPLPGGDAGGKRRGFFFDYNAPRHLSIDEAKSRTSDSADGKPLTAGQSALGSVQVSSGDVPSAGGRIVQSLARGTDPALRAGKKCKADWYDTKLAELDTSTDEEGSNKGQSKPSSSPGFSEMRQRTARALHDMRTRQLKVDDEEKETRDDEPDCDRQEEENEEPEGEIDYNVPEHYPSSPLCPANMKYWRFVDGKLGKGRYLRTCWMHGESQT